jgi:hypothetical protein
MVIGGTAQTPAATAGHGPEAPVVSERVTDEDGHVVEVFPLPTEPQCCLPSGYRQPPSDAHGSGRET